MKKRFFENDNRIGFHAKRFRRKRAKAWSLFNVKFTVAEETDILYLTASTHLTSEDDGFQLNEGPVINQRKEPKMTTTPPPEPNAITATLWVDRLTRKRTFELRCGEGTKVILEDVSSSLRVRINQGHTCGHSHDGSSANDEGKPHGSPEQRNMPREREGHPEGSQPCYCWQRFLYGFAITLSLGGRTLMSVGLDPPPDCRCRRRQAMSSRGSG